MWDPFLIFFNTWTVYAQCVNNVYAVHNSKNCLPKSTNMKKKKKMKTWTYKRGRGAQTPPQQKKVELPCPHYDNQVSIYSSLFLNTIKLKKKKKKCISETTVDPFDACNWFIRQLVHVQLYLLTANTRNFIISFHSIL